MPHKLIDYFKFILISMIAVLFFTSSFAQQNQNNKMKKNNEAKNTIQPWNKELRISPKAFIMQTIGLKDVSISYSRPGVKGRKIWGGLVPYDKVWRAGANEATKFVFTSDVLINGKKLTAGAYSFFAVPSKNSWILIFNKVADQWGAFEYNQAEDAIRFTVKPQQSEFTEWLEYSFSDMNVNKDGKNSAVVNLIWEKLRIPFTVEVQ
ncbi:MAG: DUF2911 domain-containing protein [Ignavibacteriaceae bacterium]